jgi:hypothetical protein
MEERGLDVASATIIRASDGLNMACRVVSVQRSASEVAGPPPAPRDVESLCGRRCPQWSARCPGARVETSKGSADAPPVKVIVYCINENDTGERNLLPETAGRLTLH